MGSCGTLEKIKVSENSPFTEISTYDAFGKSTNVKHDVVNKKQFTGKEIDEDSGLYYFLARYYDPETGRFLSEDTVPNGNLYVYCSQDPINKVDPDGRFGVGVTGGAIVDAGWLTGSVGAGANGSAGCGFFWGDKGFSTGAYAGGGAFGGGKFIDGKGWGKSAVENKEKDHWAAGAYGGAGAGLFITSAASSYDLEGAFTTRNFNIGFGLNIGLQLSYDDKGNWIFSAETGPGGGVALSKYKTTSVVTSRGAIDDDSMKKQKKEEEKEEQK